MMTRLLIDYLDPGDAHATYLKAIFANKPIGNYIYNCIQDPKYDRDLLWLTLTGDFDMFVASIGYWMEEDL